MRAMEGSHSMRRAGVVDAPAVARLLHEFNAEFGDRTPGPAVLEPRYAELLGGEEMAVVLAEREGEAVGFAQLRLRPSVLTGALDAYLEELYVAPERRGRGIGRALLEAAADLARELGAAHLDLNTSVDDVAARALYESFGLTNSEGAPDGPAMLYYERDL